MHEMPCVSLCSSDWHGICCGPSTPTPLRLPHQLKTKTKQGRRRRAPVGVGRAEGEPAAGREEEVQPQRAGQQTHFSHSAPQDVSPTTPPLPYPPTPNLNPPSLSCRRRHHQPECSTTSYQPTQKSSLLGDSGPFHFDRDAGGLLWSWKSFWLGWF